MTILQRALMGLVRAYQLLISPMLGGSCRFEPTCSAYAMQALQQHGAAAGSYLAVRQIAQHVQVFNDFVAAHPALNMGEAFVGRDRAHGRSPLGIAQPPSEVDAFRYLQTDAQGFECPRGAHVRRAHPRDALARSVQEGIATSKIHRLLRRGRVYTESCARGGAVDACAGRAAQRDGAQPCGRGLMFVALNADLERQFEFVQRSWIAGSRFGDLSDEQDPLLGTAANRAFTLQGCPVGQRIGALPRFTTVLGGGYFLAPGLGALRLLATGKLADIVLFGAFLLWAVLDFRAARQRDRALGTVYAPGTMTGTLIAVVVGAVAWAVFAFWLHAAWIGVAPLGR